MRLINRRPGRAASLALLLLPFALLLAAYFTASAIRLEANPSDRLLPGARQMADALGQYLAEDPRTGRHLFWADTLASLRRIGIGLGASALLALGAGVLLGAIPLASAMLSPFVKAVSMIPPLALLPILFIVFGLDDLSKVVLIVIGITPMMVRDLQQRAREIPQEVLVKAQTLGANSWTLVLRVILPQLLPRLLEALRLALCSAWLFLIAAEAIAATEGLGYRIFLVRRYLSMDLIIPCVLWITLLAWLMDEALRRVNQWAFPWFAAGARHD